MSIFLILPKATPSGFFQNQAIVKPAKATAIANPVVKLAVKEQSSTPSQPENTSPPIPTGGKYDWMSQAGISPADYGAVDYIVSHESGWCPYKWEGEIGSCPAFHGVSDYDGYGLCQSTPPQKMASAGADWETNPVTQLKWCSSYANSRYGGWWYAYDYWVANQNW